MQAARRPIEAMRAGGIALWGGLAALAAMLFAYSSLLTLGTRFGFEKGVEYWLFRPTDNAPLVILALAGWLFYRRAYRVRALPRSTASPLLLGPLVAVAIGFHAWAIYTRADDLKVVSLVLGLASIVLSLRGVRGLRALWLPLAFLLLAIPIPAPMLLAVVYQLQIWTAQFAGLLLYLIGVPALVSGDQIVRATQTFQVIEGCSGMRSIETLVMLTILLVDLFGRRGWHAAVLLLAAPIVAFFLNGFRVLTLILNPHSEIIAIHNLQGIAILLIGLLTVYGIDTLIERFVGEEAEPGWVPPADPAPRSFSRPAVATVVAALAIGTTASALATPVWVEPRPFPFALNTLVSTALEAWPSEKMPPDYAFRGSTRFGELVDATYQLEDGPVRVFVGTADLGQRGGSPLSPTTALPGSGWLVRESTPLGPAAAGGRVAEAAGADGAARDEGVAAVDVVEKVVEKGKQRRLIRHWTVGDRGLGRETWRSLLALDRSPLRRDEPFYVVRLGTPIDGRDAAAREAAAVRLATVRRALAPAFAAIAAGELHRGPTLTSVGDGL